MEESKPNIQPILKDINLFKRRCRFCSVKVNIRNLENYKKYFPRCSLICKNKDEDVWWNEGM